jgi:hypothetical protein
MAGRGPERISWIVHYRRRIFLLTRLRALLLDGHAKRIEARFIVARSQLQVFGPYSQHRGLKLYEWFGRVEPDRGAGGDTALLLAGYTASVQACVSHVVSLPFWFFGLLPATQPKRPQGEASFKSDTLKMLAIRKVGTKVTLYPFYGSPLYRPH